MIGFQIHDRTISGFILAFSGFIFDWLSMFGRSNLFSISVLGPKIALRKYRYRVFFKFVWQTDRMMLLSRYLYEQIFPTVIASDSIHFWVGLVASMTSKIGGFSFLTKILKIRLIVSQDSIYFKQNGLILNSFSY